MNIKEYFAALIEDRKKRPVPLAFYPAARRMGIPMNALLSDSGLQAACLLEMQKRLDPSLIIRMTELWVEAEAFGAEVEIGDSWFPIIKSKVIRDIDDVSGLVIPDLSAGRLPIFLDAMSKARAQNPARPLIAGVAGPYSLCSCLADPEEFMILCHSEPEEAHEFIGKVTAFLATYIKAYKDAGAHGVILAEPSIGMISPRMAEEFSHAYVKGLIARAQSDDFAVIYHSCGDVSRQVGEIARLGAMGYHFGDAFPLELALNALPKDALVLGNVHPAKFTAENEAQLMASARALNTAFGGHSNFILSSGCDISPGASYDLIRTFGRDFDE